MREGSSPARIQATQSKSALTSPWSRNDVEWGTRFDNVTRAISTALASSEISIGILPVVTRRHPVAARKSHTYLPKGRKPIYHEIRFLPQLLIQTTIRIDIACRFYCE
jgi:hypothetical protein